MMILLYEARHASPVLPWSSPHEDGISQNDKLAGTGNDGGIMSFSLGAQPLIETLEILVPALRAGKGCHVDSLAEPGTPAGDMALAITLGGLTSKGKLRADLRPARGSCSPIPACGSACRPQYAHQW